MTLKENLKKTWHFIYYDDSVWSWLVSLVLAFVLVKYIFFPTLSFIFSTTMPLVVVESGSMYHNGGFVKDVTGYGTGGEFDAWWEKSKAWYQQSNIDYDQVKNWPYKNGLDIGDIIIIRGTKNIKKGDIIVFNANQRHPIIHRIVEVNLDQKTYSTKGDNNPSQLTSIETNIKQNQIVGKAIFRIPRIGWIKLAVFNSWTWFKELIFGPTKTSTPYQIAP